MLTQPQVTQNSVLPQPKAVLQDRDTPGTALTCPARIPVSRAATKQHPNTDAMQLRANSSSAPNPSAHTLKGTLAPWCLVTITGEPRAAFLPAKSIKRPAESNSGLSIALRNPICADLKTHQRALCSSTRRKPIKPPCLERNGSPAQEMALCCLYTASTLPVCTGNFSTICGRAIPANDHVCSAQLWSSVP